ncbi:DUF2254 domain-containing protein [Litchfieldella xinjiangensis]|uniref:DUF2254 domain-containing protein n=1 Tax=Litchfieldella xinjiangensis TaxID=1166948 RepID=UPI0005BCE39C|nr:DUF2254 family protein [Halomonas xinjiangensis]
MSMTSALRFIINFRNSIAYLTSIIILAYVILGLIAVSVEPPSLPDALNVIRFDQPGTARTLLSTLIAGMISLVVFSFSMVMSVLTQAGSNFSNKLVFGLMTEKKHQHVLGHYLGTILYILILLLVPAASDTPDTWRSLAVYLGAAMVINSLGLFVFFIHSASQSVQINAITQDLLESTRQALKKLKRRQEDSAYICGHQTIDPYRCHPVFSRYSGYIQSAELKKLAKLAKKKNIAIHFNFSFGVFVVKHFPIIHIESSEPPSNEILDEIQSSLKYVEGESTEDHYVNGLTQLMEVAIKALSPGINDPGTARLCVHQITELFSQRLTMTPSNMIVDSDGKCLVSWHEEALESLMFRVFNPILHYGGDDLSICLSLLSALKTLSNFAEPPELETIQRHADRIIQRLAQDYTDPLEVDFVEARLSEGVHRLSLPQTLQAPVAG